MNSEELEAMIGSNAKKAGKYFQNLKDGLITVEEYADNITMLDMGELQQATTFSDQEDFEKYMRENYPTSAEEHIDYISQQLKKMKEYGIKTITFGVFEADDGRFQVVLSDNMAKNCRDWEPEKMITYVEELLGGDETSPTDHTAIGE